MLGGRTIVITGATSGIGEACARLFAQHGATLVLTGRRQERLEKLAADLSDASVHTLALDSRDRDAVGQQFANLPEPFSAVDVLINNAGLALSLMPFQDMQLDDAEQMIDTNIKGLIYAAHSLLPGMIERSNGHIVNIGSIAGTYPYPGNHVYGATKSFVKQFTLNLKADLLGTPVKVTNIEPAMTETEFALVRHHGDEQKAKDTYSSLEPLMAGDIAESILWCITRPARVNINSMEVMPVDQASGPLAVNKK